ncbi:MAG TPA: MOSC N-terminal beta barrel domain-containing protein [Segetibacter sp.]
MNDLVLQDIYIYPIKSLGGISITEAEVQPAGLKYDRRWMLVDSAGMFVSQRSYSQLAMLQANIKGDALVIQHKKNSLSPLTIPFDATTNKELTVSIWDDICTASEVSILANEWFSEALQMKVQLVYMPSTTKRVVDIEYAANNEIVSFADAYPFMMIGQSSLDDLNSRLAQPVLMNRFRPNFVFSGGAPFLEDNMKAFTIGEVRFKGVKLCARCVLTTINQEQGTKGQEPLKTLATYRTINNKVMFGQNLLNIDEGLVKVGDKIIAEA